uniref:Checkpoint protein n=1 Tax=Erpetoichthys calabaricus TaxID=27687 RepID=A0A8C4T7P3_ERPCA
PNIVKKFNDSSCLCVVNTVSKLTKMCTLRLTKEKLFFMLTDKVANGGVSMWSELLQVFMELPKFVLSFKKQAHNANQLKNQTDKNNTCPCINIAVELPSYQASVELSQHDIPVELISRRLWNDFREPGLLKFIFKVLEANMNGEMNLKIDTDLVSVSTHFRDLGNPPFSKECYFSVCFPCSIIHTIS